MEYKNFNELVQKCPYVQENIVRFIGQGLCHSYRIVCTGTGHNYYTLHFETENHQKRTFQTKDHFIQTWEMRSHSECNPNVDFEEVDFEFQAYGLDSAIGYTYLSSIDCEDLSADGQRQTALEGRDLSADGQHQTALKGQDLSANHQRQTALEGQDPALFDIGDDFKLKSITFTIADEFKDATPLDCGKHCYDYIKFSKPAEKEISKYHSFGQKDLQTMYDLTEINFNALLEVKPHKLLFLEQDGDDNKILELDWNNITHTLPEKRINATKIKALNFYPKIDYSDILTIGDDVWNSVEFQYCDPDNDQSWWVIMDDNSLYLHGKLYLMEKI